MRQLTFTGKDTRDLVWAPDGNHIAFSTPDGIWWTRADGGSDPQLLLKTASRANPYSFSPDGKFLAYSQVGAGTSGDIWMLPLDVTDPDHPKAQTPQVFLNSTAGESLPAFSPDGHWVAYVSSGPEGDRQEASRNVWVRAFPGAGGNRWQVSTDGGLFPIWSSTSSQLFFEKRGGVIMVADYTARGDSFTVEKVRQWSDKTIYEPGQGSPLALAPDGKHFLILSRPLGTSQPVTHLTFLLHFFDELRRRAPETR
jgi:Tol biopolymer transport system component